jgi:transposase InsO family protein
MQQEGLRAKAAKKFRVTTDSSHGKPVAPNLINRNFTVLSPNEVWCGDITYLWTKEGWLYLAVFIDLYSRMVVGWSIGTRLDASLVTTAFRNAVARRRPKIGLIVHTDQGVQYTSEAFLQALSAVSAKQSMSRRGNCWDNAPTESFFHSFKVEAIYGEDLETRREMEYEVFDYIERFYNRRRKHSTLGYCSPINFEQSFRVKQKVAA